MYNAGWQFSNQSTLVTLKDVFGNANHKLLLSSIDHFDFLIKTNHSLNDI